MALNAMDKIRLGRQLNSLIQNSSMASGLRKITVGRQINALLIQLGYSSAGGTAGVPASSSEVDKFPAENNQSQPESNDRPEVVEAFLNGDFVTQESVDFTKTLTLLEPYLDAFLTMDDVVAGASDWLREKYPEAA